MLLRRVSVLFIASCCLADPTQRSLVLDEMDRRPGDPWPRGSGHVVLAVPGTPESEKAYVEPGGSISPSFGSFGLSLWVFDDSGKRVATSDDFPLEKTRADFPGGAAGFASAALETTTPAYRIEAAVQRQPRRVGLAIRPAGKGGRLTLALRSVGPAGGPVTHLAWTGSALVVNRRWSLTLVADGAALAPRFVGDETVAGWATASSAPTNWAGAGGWGAALFDLPAGKPVNAVIDDRMPPAPLVSAYLKGNVGPILELPDARFTACLDAQLRHLLMGLVGDETRPGEPNNYALNWLRDGAFVLAMLARANFGEAARELSGPFEAHDFFGGFGAEADGPGLSLWAITEVSRLRPRDTNYAARIWPAVGRKADLILRMLDANAPIRMPWHGPLVPGKGAAMEPDLVCDAAMEGLIRGKMDGHRPVLYVNAAAYAGLRNAAGHARRLGHTNETEAWTARAVRLRADWNRAFASGRHENERNRICGLHPSWIVSDRAAYGAAMLRARQASHDTADSLKGRPLWTYFNLAEAHQWLLLGEPRRAWSDLEWFWSRQEMPGAYSWWEGRGEENGFGRWQDVRGWVRPPNVTPHYWTAVEMLGLQLSMLAHVDESGPEPELVVGAGVPASWLAAPRLRVGRLRTPEGPLDWEYSGGEILVSGWSGRIRAGSEFPATTRVVRTAR